jgi:hypothetical protein
METDFQQFQFVEKIKTVQDFAIFPETGLMLVILQVSICEGDGSQHIQLRIKAIHFFAE